MNNKLQEILAVSLEAIENDEHTIQEIQERFPEYQEELQALLDTASSIRTQATITPRPAFLHSTPNHLLQRLTPRHPVKTGRTLPHNWLNMARNLGSALVIVAFALIISLVSTGSIVYASGSAIPGDFLYPIKLSVEEGRLFVADEEQASILQVEFLQTRMDEMDQLLQSNREANLPQMAAAFSETISRATESISSASQKDKQQARNQAALLQEILSSQSEQLTFFLATAPEHAKPSLLKILEKNKEGKVTVEEWYADDLPDEKSPNQNNGRGSTIIPPSSIDPSLDVNPENGLQPSKTPHNTNQDDKHPDPKLTPTVFHGPPDWVLTKKAPDPSKKPGK